MYLSKSFHRSVTNVPSVPNHGHLAKSINANKAIIPQTNHLSMNRTNPKIDTNLKISHTSLDLGHGKQLVNISIDAIAPPIVKPSVFVCALDVSGSMDGPSTYVNDPEASKFSRLDLVKHSMNTIIHCLGPSDELSMITFSNTASKILPLTRMDEPGKKSALQALQQIRADGQTNLWDGLNQSLDELSKTNVGPDRNFFSLLLTDGEPNMNPPRGIYNEFVARDARSTLFSGLHTFGYGYGLDSDLLNKLSKTGGGLFAHIPDHTMCNTVFINFLSNCLATSINKVDMHFRSVRGQHHISTIGNTLNEQGILNVGPIQSGQTQNIMLGTQVDNKNNFRIELGFSHDGKQTQYVIDNPNPNVALASDPNNMLPFVSDLEKLADSGMGYHLSKILLINIITSGMTQFDLPKICAALDKLYEMINKLAVLTSNMADKKKLHALLTNIKSTDANEGQIYKAFSKQEWFDRWGIHYLKYFVRSHQLQVCSNFKDSSLQLYGGQLFREIRTEVEDIFSKIPIPKPSLSSTPFTGNFTSTFYSPTGPCFDGYGLVKLANGSTELVKNLIKGDTIINSDGNTATIQCIIKTAVKNIHTDMVLFDGVKVTPWHPIRVNGQWIFPCDLKEPIKVHCEYVYNFVMDQHHIITVSGLDGITLGHNFTHDPVLVHPFLGSNKVIDHLKTNPGWKEGLVEILEYNPTYDENGLISSFF